MNHISTKRRQRKSMLGTRRASMQFKPLSPQFQEPFEVENSRKSIFIKPPSPESQSPEPTVENQTAEDEPYFEKKSVICSLFPNSFEANETLLAKTLIEEKESVPSLFSDSFEANETMFAKVLVYDKDDTLEQILKSVQLLLEKNSLSIENNLKEKEMLIEMKQRVLKNS